MYSQIPTGPSVNLVLRFLHIILRELRVRFFVFAFTKEWVYKNFISRNFTDRKTVLNFLSKKDGFYTGLDVPLDTLYVFEKISETIEGLHKDSSRAGLKKSMSKVMIRFFEKSILGNRFLNQNSLNSSDYQRTDLTESIILKVLHSSFKGIDTIAREVNVSATKLKSDFKSIYGFSMLQYHKKRNLRFALQLVQHTSISMQNIAGMTGFESAGRFAATFKKRFGLLPSKARLEVLKMTFFVNKYFFL